MTQPLEEEGMSRLRGGALLASNISRNPKLINLKFGITGVEFTKGTVENSELARLSAFNEGLSHLIGLVVCILTGWVFAEISRWGMEDSSLISV